MGSFDYVNRTIEFERLVVTNAAVKALTEAKYAGAKKAVLTVEGSNVRISTGSAQPTTTSGLLIKDGDMLTLEGNEIKAFKVISITSDATLNIEYKG